MNAKTEIVRKTDRNYIYRLRSTVDDSILHEITYTPFSVDSVWKALHDMQQFVDSMLESEQVKIHE